MPPALIEQARLAVRRQAARHRYEAMLDALMGGGAEWGTAIEGQMPPNTASYRTVDKPARAHLQALYVQSLGEQQAPSVHERQQTHRVLLNDIFTDMN